MRVALGNSQQETEAIGLVACKGLNVANQHATLEADPSPDELQVTQTLYKCFINSQMLYNSSPP